MAEARFHDACDALRAKLREVEDEGWVSIEADAASQDASAAGKSSSGLAALRIVLQHVCQADHAVLSARPDAPDECYAVTCQERDFFRSYSRDVYKPAVTSKECAWRLCEELAESIAGEMDGEVELDLFRGERWTYTVQVPEPGLGEIEERFLIKPTAYVLDGTIEGAETFLDLRSLAALRIVVGPDKSFAKMFSAVVSLRETKMPRILYAEHRNDGNEKYEEGFSFSDLMVSKSHPTTCLVAARGECNGPYGDEGCQCRKYTAEVLKLAAKADTLWLELPEPRPPITGPMAGAIVIGLRATRNLPSDATVVYAEDWGLDQTGGDEHRVMVAVRPLPLAAEADAVAKWEEDVLTYKQRARRELDAASP